MSFIGKRCLNCMHELGESNICPYCGYFQKSDYPDYVLKPGTILEERYYIGNMLSENSEGITYIAYDTHIDSRVEIREYMPRTLSERADATGKVKPLSGKESLFKALMSDFRDLARALSKYRTLPDLKQIYEVFEQNNTVYYVSEHIESNMTLAKVLQQSDELFDWKVLSKHIIPLINTVGILNASNIIHRGISPESIFVTPKGEFKLGNFCISAVRASKAELPSEIVDGYAAPEQYSVNSWYGPWTDVYAICAVIYRALTGIAPPDVKSRSEEDRLTYPRNINPKIPQAVADALMSGLKLAPESRIQSMQNLSALLNRAMASQVSLDEEKQQDKPEKKKKAAIIAAVIGGILLLALTIWAIIFSLSDTETPKNVQSFEDISIPHTSRVSSSTQSGTSSIAGVAYSMPNLVGLEYQKVIINDDYTSLVDIEYKEDYSDKYAKGVIMKQSIKPETPIALKTKVTVTVSKGSRTRTIPDYKGKTLSQYINELNELDIAFKAVLKDPNGPVDGVIAGVNPGVGSEIDISKGEYLQILLDNTQVEISSSESSDELTGYDFE